LKVGRSVIAEYALRNYLGPKEARLTSLQAR
jgi:hypothetical protein